MTERNSERKSELSESKVEKLRRFIDKHNKGIKTVGVNRVKYKKGELENLCEYATAIFAKEPTLLEIRAPVTICGDIHGQFNDLIRMLATLGTPPKRRYLFLGDYVDRGRMGLETIVLLLAYKVLYPENFFLLRGNHECQKINERYGFLSECQRIFNSKTIYRKINKAFEFMPLCALVGQKILCMHGGLSPRLRELKDIRNIKKPIYDPEEGTLVNDILWSDPEVRMSGWDDNTRGTSYIFGKDIVEKYCKKLEIQLIVRAHQVCQSGYRFFADRKLVTIFSAPNYCGDSGNDASVMDVDESLCCNFISFKPTIKKTAPKPAVQSKKS